ncbi:unnamed protein product [Lampetra planeri]
MDVSMTCECHRLHRSQSIDGRPTGGGQAPRVTSDSATRLAALCEVRVEGILGEEMIKVAAVAAEGPPPSHICAPRVTRRLSPAKRTGGNIAATAAQDGRVPPCTHTLPSRVPAHAAVEGLWAIGSGLGQALLCVGVVAAAAAAASVDWAERDRRWNSPDDDAGAGFPWARRTRAGFGSSEIPPRDVAAHAQRDGDEAVTTIQSRESWGPAG